MTNCITQLWLRKLLPFTVSLFYQKPYAFVNCRLFQTPGIFMRKYGPFPCRMTNFTGVPSILKAHHHFPDHTSIPKTPVSGQTTLPPATHLHPFEFPCISLYHKSRRAHCLKSPQLTFVTASESAVRLPHTGIRAEYMLLKRYVCISCIICKLSCSLIILRPKCGIAAALAPGRNPDPFPY